MKTEPSAQPSVANLTFKELITRLATAEFDCGAIENKLPRDYLICDQASEKAWDARVALFNAHEAELRAAVESKARLIDALENIALAGMSPSPEMSENGVEAWHARQAWNFIGIAARALQPSGESK